jgi:hypothetical protein
MQGHTCSLMTATAVFASNQQQPGDNAVRGGTVIFGLCFCACAVADQPALSAGRQLLRMPEVLSAVMSRLISIQCIGRVQAGQTVCCRMPDVVTKSLHVSAAVYVGNPHRAVQSCTGRCNDYTSAESTS